MRPELEVESPPAGGSTVGFLINREITETDLLQSLGLWLKEHLDNRGHQGQEQGKEAPCVWPNGHQYLKSETSRRPPQSVWETLPPYVPGLTSQ
jgi:hypothetical protein